MAIANREAAEALDKSFRTITLNSLSDQSPFEIMDLAVMEVESNTQTEEYLMGRDFQTMKEWIGEREMDDFEWDSFSISNKLYEAGFQVSRTDIEDDRLGMFEMRTQSRALAYPRKRRSTVMDVLLDNPTGYDGVSLFSASHPQYNEAGDTQSNYTASAFDLTGTNYDTVRKEMMQLEDHQNEPLDIEPDTLIIGPENMDAARDLFGPRTVDTGGENVYFNDVRVVIEKKITDSRWFLLDSTQVLKPVILQNRTGLEFQNIIDPDSEYVVKNDAFFYGLRSRWGVGPAFWQSIHGCNF